MTEPIATDTLENGLTITYVDRSRPYFGGYYRVQVEITTSVQLEEWMFVDQETFHNACRLLGSSVTYRRLVEKMGVASTELARVRTEIVESFQENALGYLKSDDFPERFVQGEYAKIIAKPSYRL
ncbi:MAG TPA: hypothetical protein VFR01_09360 [Geobacterales bacterium]|nr:hypothetical protein [Geobacterales bacterium]